MWGMQETETESMSAAFQVCETCGGGRAQASYLLLFFSTPKATSVVTDTQQCNQAQPCGNCARRYPPPVCEYKSNNQRCAPPALLLDMLTDILTGTVTAQGRQAYHRHRVLDFCLFHSPEMSMLP